MNRKSKALLAATLLTSSVIYPWGAGWAANLTADQQAVYDAVIEKLQIGRGPGLTIGKDSSTEWDTSVAIGPNATTVDSGSIAIGNNAKVFNTNAQFATVIGDRAESAHGSIVIGKKAKDYDTDPSKAGDGVFIGLSAKSLGGTNQVVVGNYGQAEKQDSIAIGHMTKALGFQAAAVGGRAMALDKGTSAFGANSIAEFQNSTALGGYTNARGYNSLAVGKTNVAAGNNSVAIGYQSYAHNGYISKSSYNALSPEEKEKYFEVSTLELYFLKDPTDAYSGQSYFNTAVGAYSRAFKHAATLGGSTFAQENGTAIGTYAKANKKGAVALGYQAIGNASNAIAIGNETVADIDNSVALGSRSLAHVGDDVATKAYLTDEVFAKENGVVSIGNVDYSIGGTRVEANRRRITNVAGGADTYDAVNVAQLQAVEAEGLNFKGDGDTVLHRDLGTELIISGGNTDITTLTDGNIGVVADKDNGSLSVKLSKNINMDDGSVTFAETAKDAEGNTLVKGEDGNWYTDLTDAVYDVDTQTYSKNGETLTAVTNPVIGTVKLTSTGLNNGNQRITNVAAGVDNTDAVNMSQLTALNTKVDANKIEYVSINSSEEGNKLNDGAKAKDSIAIGPNVKTTVEAGVAIGRNIDSRGGVAVGDKAYSSSQYSVAIGMGAIAGETDVIQADVAIGDGAKAKAYSVAIGNGANAFMDPDPETNGSGLAVAIGDRAKVKGQGSVAIGSGALAEFSSSAMGINAKANGRNAVAIGDRSNATGNSTVAIGFEAKTDSVYGVAIGPAAKGLGFGSVGIGGEAEATANWSMAMGQKSAASAQLSMALGHYSKATSLRSVALGNYASTEMGTDATAVGYKAKTTSVGGVSLGAYSVADRAGGVYGYTVDGVTFASNADIAAYLGKTAEYQAAIEDFNAKLAILNEKKAALAANPNNKQLKAEVNEAGAATQASFEARNAIISAYRSGSGAVSVGNLGDTRQIINVAAGSQDTDAVNLAQLKTVNSKVDANKIEYVSINSTEDGNKANDGATGTNAIAIGPNAKATAYASIGIGSGQKINQDDPQSDYKKVDSKFAIAIGQESVIDDKSEVSIATGYQSEISNSVWANAYGPRAKVVNSQQGTAIGQSTLINNSAFGTALGTYAKVTDSDSGIAIGSKARVEGAPYGMAIGIDSSVTNQGGVALGYGTFVTEKSGVALGLGAIADRSAEVYGYSPDGTNFTDDASIAAYLGKTAEFEAANQDYAKKVEIFHEKAAEYQQHPRDPEAIKAYIDAANDVTASFAKRNGIIAAYKPHYGAASVGGSGATRQIINVAAGTEDTDAVNLAQLKTVETIAKAHTELTLDGKSAEAGANGALGDYIGDNNLTMAVKDVNGQKVYDLKLKNEVVIGQPGKDGKDGTPGSIGLVGPQGPAGEDGQPGKNAYGEISVKNGADGVDGTNGKDGMTRIVYVDENDKEHTVATLEDGLKFAGDTKDVTIAKKLNDTLEVKGGISDTNLLTDNNIGVVAQANGGLTVKLAKNLDLADGSVRIGGTTGEDGAVTGGIYIAKQQGVATSIDGKTEDGSFITGLTNTKWDPATNGIVSGRAATEDQLEKAISKVSEAVGGAHTELTLDGKSATAGADGELGKYIGDNNLTMAVKDVNGQKVYDLKLKNEVVIGQPGKAGKDGTPGSIGLVGPQGPAGEDGQPGKNAYGEISVKNGADGVDGTNGKDGMTRIVYVDENDKEHTVATLEDGLKFAGDTKDVTIAKKLNETLEVKGGISDTSLLTDNNIGVVAKSDGGLTVKLAKKIDLADGSVTIASQAMKDDNGNWLVKGEDGKWYTDLTDAVYDADTQTYTKGGETLEAVANLTRGSVKLNSTGLDNGNQRIVNVAAGIDGTDAVNVAQLKKEISDVTASVGGAHTELTLDGKSATAGADGALGKYIGDNNLTMAVKDVNGQKVYDLKLSNQVVIGQPGKDGKDGTPGSIGLVGPKGKDGEDGQPGKNAYGEISVKNGADGVDGKHGKDGITRIVYVDENDEEHTVATLEDGLKFAGDTENVTIAKKLNETLTVTGGISDTSLLTDNNIGVVAQANGGLTVKLAKNIKLADGSITIASEAMKDENGKWLVKGEDGNWYSDLRGAVYDADTQTYTKDGVALTAVTNLTRGSVTLSPTGLDNGNQRIVNVAPGKADNDAVNLGQLRAIADKPEHHNRVTVYGETAEPGENGEHGEYVPNHNLTMGVREVDGELIHDIQLSKFVDLEEGQLTFTVPQDENNPTFRQAADANTSQVTLSAAGLDSGNQRIVNVADGVDDKDAVNVSQLKANKVTLTAGANIKLTDKTEDAGSTNYTIASTDTITGLTNTTWDSTNFVTGRAATEDQLNAAISNVSEAVGGAHTEITLAGETAIAGENGALGEYIGENNLTMAVKEVNGQKVYDLKLKNEVVIGQPGKDGKDGTPGSIGLVGPAGPKGEDGQPGKNAYGEISVKNGADGVDGTNGKDGMTRIVYVDENDKEHTVATMEDGLKFAGDTKDVTIAKKLNETLDVKGGISDATQLSDNNIGVVAADGGLRIKLAKNINLNDGSIRVGGTTGEDGMATGGIYIANQNGVTTTKANTTEDGLFITGLTNTDWNPEANGIVENRAATEKQLKAVADSSARVDAANLSDANVNSWKSKLGITDTLLGEAGAWKLTVNGTGERSIKKDSVINFVNGSKVQIAQSGNDITVGLDPAFVKSVEDNTTNITNLDNRVTKVEGDVTNINKDITKIQTDITNINTKIETIEGKAGVANVEGDSETGVKVEKVDANDATKGVKVSLDEKITVGGITIDGTTSSEGETATANRTITGLTNTTWDADKAVDNRAATEGQLKDFAKSIAGTAGATTINGDNNINAVKVDGKNEYNLSLNADLKVGNSIAVDNMTYISKDGINANDKEIKNVKAVELTADGTSAATTGQVYGVRQEMATAIGGVATAVQNNARQISKLDSKVNKSGAGASALAALHPLDYDPDNKWNFTAGVGTYHGSNAMAIGAFYRPNEDLLFSVGGSMGNGENMMNMGVSMKFGNSNPYAGMSKGRLIEYVEKQTSEIDALKAQNESQNERIQKLEELVNTLIAG